MSKAQERRDYARKPLPFLIAWGLPLAVLLSGIVFHEALPAAAKITLVAGAYAWMGIACVVNALRCGRLHCYLSGPILLAGAALILLTGFAVLDLGPVNASLISYATLALVMLTFVLEWIWGPYLGIRKDRES